MGVGGITVHCFILFLLTVTDFSSFVQCLEVRCFFQYFLRVLHVSNFVSVCVCVCVWVCVCGCGGERGEEREICTECTAISDTCMQL